MPNHNVFETFSFALKSLRRFLYKTAFCSCWANYWYLLTNIWIVMVAVIVILIFLVKVTVKVVVIVIDIVIGKA